MKFMKIVKIILIAALCFAGFNANAQRRTRAFMDHKQFYAPGIGNYLEVYFQFVGHTLDYIPVEEGLQTEVYINIGIFKDEQAIQSNAYRLQSPVMKDSIIDDFYDVQRFSLEPGRYRMSIEIADLIRNGESIKADQYFDVEDLSNSISISDVLVAESAAKTSIETPFFKSGYEIIPHLSTYYPEELSFIPVYMEFYGTGQLEDSVFAIKQSVINLDTEKTLENYENYSRHSKADVVPYFKVVNIEELPSGKYALQYTLVTKNMEELSTQAYTFERSNSSDQVVSVNETIIDPAFQQSIPEDSVSFYLASLVPIAKPETVKMILKELKDKNAESQRLLLQAFWIQTGGTNPYESWLRYKRQVGVVEKLYSNNFQVGFETDRGRVYLQYGSPNQVIQRENSSSEYPYEIWQYDKIGKFSNRRFVFYNPDLVNNTYRLLHSDMVGEIKNPKWPSDLSRRNTRQGDVDDPNLYKTDSFGNNSQKWYNQY